MLSEGSTFRRGPGGLTFAQIENDLAVARICLQGAQLIHWQPRSQAESVTFTSAAAQLSLRLCDSRQSLALWPYRFALDYRIQYRSRVHDCRSPAQAAHPHCQARQPLDRAMESGAEEGSRSRGPGSRSGNPRRVAAIRLRRECKCARQHADAGGRPKALSVRSLPGRADLAGRIRSGSWCTGEHTGPPRDRVQHLVHDLRIAAAFSSRHVEGMVGV